MKIYPDPELPDLEVQWSDFDCEEKMGTDVALALVGVDTPSFRRDLAVACADQKVTFVDIPRERFRLEGTLSGAGGETFGMHESEVDVRDGLDRTEYLYFQTQDNFVVRWTFDSGATCASLGADAVLIEFSTASQMGVFGFGDICEVGAMERSVPPGTYTIHAVAYTSNADTVAVSPETAELVVDFKLLVDAGTLVLSPCGTMCP